MIHPRSIRRRSTHARRTGSLATGLGLCAAALTACSDVGRSAAASALRLVGREVRGLPGLNFLRSFRMTLDFERRTLQLTQPQDGRPSGRATRRGAT